MKKFLGLVGSALVAASVSSHAFAYSKTFDDYSTVGALGVPLVAGIITLTKGDEDGMWQLAESYALTMGATYGLKQVVHEDRPDHSDNDSFPSGHTSSAFAGAAFLQFRYGWQYGIPAYIAAAAVGWSRVDSDHHHWQDVLASAALANVSAYFLTDKFEQKVAVAPIVEPETGTYGLMAAMRF